MAISRKSFTDDDVERIAETIYQLDYKNTIKNKDDFNKFYDAYLGDNGTELRNDDTSRQRVFENFVFRFPDKITEPTALKEYDNIEVAERKKINRNYNYIGKVNNHVVYLKKTFETRNGKKYIVFRDRRGRIGKVKNQEERYPVTENKNDKSQINK